MPRLAAEPAIRLLALGWDPHHDMDMRLRLRQDHNVVDTTRAHRTGARRLRPTKP